MWDGYCGQLIRRINRNLLCAILVIATVAGSVIYFKREYLGQFLHGPSSVDAAVVALRPTADQFVRVRLKRIFYVGIDHTTSERSGPDRIDSQYFVTSAGGKLLILRIPDGGHPDEIAWLTFEGRVRPLPADLSEALEKRRRPDFPPIANQYIDGEDYRGPGIELLLLGIPLLLFWLWLLWRYLQGASDFSQHFFAKRVAKYGQLEAMIHEIDTEFASAHSAYSRISNKVDLTQNWLLTRTPFGGDAIRLNHLTWAHQFLLKRKLYYVITVGKYYFLDAYDDMGKKIHIKLTKEIVESVLGELSASRPQAVIGYSSAVQRLWKRFRKEPDRFLQEVRMLAGQTRPAMEAVGSKIVP